MDKIIKVDAVPYETLPLITNKNALSKHIVDLFIDDTIEDALFRSAKMHWKYWVKLEIFDIEQFVSGIVNEETCDFYLVSTKSKFIISLSSEEENYWIFNIKSSEC